MKGVDEIVIVDSGSTDNTLEICRRWGVRLYTFDDWRGFGVQKNRVLQFASSDWILSLDADEWASDSLRAEIFSTILKPRHDVYRVKRKSSFCGKRIKYSGWQNDYIARLFRHGTASFSNDTVHESLVYKSQTAGLLDSPLYHESYRDFHDVLQKVQRYSTLGALRAGSLGTDISLTRAVLKGFWAFFRTFILRFGFLDGRYGFALAVANGEAVYYRCLKQAGTTRIVDSLD
jgi:glycosyltransferase involved in cell wall biosynthesis